MLETIHLLKQNHVHYEEYEVLLKRKFGCEGWKELKDAGRRWIAEIVFSSIKRVPGEDFFSKKFKAQQVEAGLKIMLYNKFISI